MKHRILTTIERAANHAGLEAVIHPTDSDTGRIYINRPGTFRATAVIQFHLRSDFATMQIHLAREAGESYTGGGLRSHDRHEVFGYSEASKIEEILDWLENQLAPEVRDDSGNTESNASLVAIPFRL